jgi:methylated-DNA-[protein]-cysteine S-methyltransferase
MKQTTDELTTRSQWLGDAPGTPSRETWMHALDALYGRAPAHDQAKLRRVLADAQTSGVWYDSIASTHLGRVFFAATATGLVAVSFGVSERAFRERVGAALGVEARVARAPGTLWRGRIGQQLREYLAGRRTRFDLPLDLRTLPEFQRRVLLAALEIPHGQVTTYGELARRIGRPKAARAVGQALGHNPVPLVIPCHRVLGADGSLHGYGAGKGLQTKAWLLALEGARFG